MPPRLSRYTAVSTIPFQYPDGVLCLGETALLSEDDAQNGLAQGLIALSPSVPTPSSSKSAPISPESETN